MARPVVRAEGARVSDLANALAAYESGASVAPLREIENLVRQSMTHPALRQELEASLALMMEGKPTFEARYFASRQLAILGSERSLAALSGLLKNKDTVELACLALCVHPLPQAEQVLLQELPGLAGNARLQVIHTLGDRRAEPAVSMLVSLTRNSDQAVAEAAIIALGKIGNRTAREHISMLRKANDPAIAPTVIEASLRMAEKLSIDGHRDDAKVIYEEFLGPSQPAHVRRGAFNALLKLDRDDGENRILAVLRDNDALLKPVAIAAVSGLKSPRASRRFGREMPRLSSPEQVFMIEALADRADAGARKVIADHVLASDSAVQLAAIEASGRLGNGSSVSLLSGVLAGTGTAKAGAAAERALVELKGGQATDQAIIRELQRASASLKPRFISVLARRGSSTALPVLLEESRSANATVAKASCQALGRLAGEKEAPILVDYLSKLADADIRDDAEAAAIQVLNRIPAPSARSELVCPKLGQTTDPAQRASLIRLLLACGDARAIKTLEPECDSPATLVRNAAVRTLADWPTLAAWNPLMRYYRQDRDESYRVLALRGLVRLAGEENPRPDLAQVDRYRQLLAAAKGNGDRKLILGAMAGCSHPEALRLALPLLAQPAVRAEAASAVKTLAESLKPQHPQLAADALKQLSNENF